MRTCSCGARTLDSSSSSASASIGADRGLSGAGGAAGVVGRAGASASARGGDRGVDAGPGVGQGIEGFTARQRFDLGDKPGRQGDRTALADARDHAVQAIEAAFEHDHAGVVEFLAAFGHGLEQRFHGVAEVADGEDAGHARAALERVQVALQAGDQFAVAGVLAQVGQQAIGMIEDVVAFLEEDVEQFDVEVGDVEVVLGIGRIGGNRHGRARGADDLRDRRWRGHRCEILRGIGEQQFFDLRFAGLGRDRQVGRFGQHDLGVEIDELHRVGSRRLCRCLDECRVRHFVGGHRRRFDRSLGLSFSLSLGLSFGLSFSLSLGFGRGHGLELVQAHAVIRFVAGRRIGGHGLGLRRFGDVRFDLRRFRGVGLEIDRVNRLVRHRRNVLGTNELGKFGSHGGVDDFRDDGRRGGQYRRFRGVGGDHRGQGVAGIGRRRDRQRFGDGVGQRFHRRFRGRLGHGFRQVLDFFRERDFLEGKGLRIGLGRRLQVVFE